MPVGNIIKFFVTREHYRAFKAEAELHRGYHIFELPAIGVYADAATVKAFYSAHSLTDATLASYPDDQKLFVCHII